MMKQRTVCYILILFFMCLTAFYHPYKADAKVEYQSLRPQPTESAPPKEHFDYTVTEDDEIEIRGYYGDKKVLVVPETIEGRNVTGIYSLLPSGKEAEEIYLPDTVRKLPSTFFDGYENLRVVDVGGLSSLYDSWKGYSSFMWGCDNLEVFMTGDSADFPIEAGYLGDITMFRHEEKLKYIYIGNHMENVSEYLFYKEGLQQAEVGEENPVYQSIDGIVYSKDGKRLIVCGTMYPYDEVEIPEGVEQIETGFESCFNIKKVKIPASVTAISEYSFKDISPVLVVRENSYADTYAKKQSLATQYYGEALPEPTILPEPTTEPNQTDSTEMSDSSNAQSHVTTAVSVLNEQSDLREKDLTSTLEKSVTTLSIMQKNTVKKSLDKVAWKTIKAKKRRKVKISFQKTQSAQGYQIQYAGNKKFKKKKTRQTTKVTLTLKNLKKGKMCYIRIRAYTANGGKKIYGKWSSVKKVKVKK